MKKVTFQIATNEGFVDASGWADPEVPGLVVAKAPPAPNWPGASKAPWVIYHHQGKRVMSPYRVKADAVEALLLLAPMTDWTQDQAVLKPMYDASDVYACLHQTGGTP